MVGFLRAKLTTLNEMAQPNNRLERSNQGLLPIANCQLPTVLSMSFGKSAIDNRQLAIITIDAKFVYPRFQ